MFHCRNRTVKAFKPSRNDSGCHEFHEKRQDFKQTTNKRGWISGQHPSSLLWQRVIMPFQYAEFTQQWGTHTPTHSLSLALFHHTHAHTHTLSLGGAIKKINCFYINKMFFLVILFSFFVTNWFPFKFSCFIISMPISPVPTLPLFL